MHRRQRLRTQAIRALSIVILATLGLAGCGAVNDMTGALEKQQRAQQLAKDRHGLNVQIGWNMHNGVLTQITVVFHSNEVRGRSVAALEGIAEEVIAATFESKPRTLNIQITNAPPAQT